MILVLDNYDSFTYNIVQYLGERGEDVKVVRNDALTVGEIEQLNPDYIMISPGPCTPDEAGISLEVIARFAGQIPILGVCLGHQCIAQAFGGKVIRADRLMHGKTSEVEHDGKTIFKDIPNPFTAMRYHSLIAEASSLPDELVISAQTKEGEVMAIRHRDYSIEGVQFHPESIMTKEGKQLFGNFLDFYAKASV